MQEKPELTLTESRSRHFLFGSLGAFVLFLLAFVVVPYVTASVSATNRVNAAVDWGSVSLTFDPDMDATTAGTSAPGDATHGDVDFGTLTPSYSSSTSNGTMKVVKRKIGVTTTGNYYSVYLSSVDNTTGLALTSTVDGTPVSTSTGVDIPALGSDGTTGTFASPSTFGSATGWGYAVPGVENTGIENAPSTFVVPTLVNQQITGTSDAPGAYETYHQTTWAGISPRNNPQQIWKASAADELVGFSEGDSFDVYYGVMINENTLSGSYSNEIVYTALASASALDRVSSNISHNRYAGGKGDIINISFDLADSLTNVTKSMVKVALVPHSVMLANKTATDEYQISGLNFADYPSCPIVSFTHPSGNEYINLSCVLPEGAEGDQYDFWVKVNSYNIDYISKDYSGNDLVASLTYAGLQTNYPSSDPRSGNKVITEMQDMTEGVCSLSNAWGTGTGTDARVYNYTGTGETLGVATTDTDQLMNIGTFALTDNRDNKTYLVRRLADGNCWMVQNLDLDLASFAGTENLTADNTDLNSKDVWDPSASALAIAKEYDPTVTQENYFETFAINRLGNAQKVQFQPKGVKGSINNIIHYWGSVIDDNGQTLSAPANNARAVIPRSYDNEYDYAYEAGNATLNSDATYSTSNASKYVGDYYNWYAATAESGTYEMTSGNADDSICPGGWQLPVFYYYDVTTPRSWGQLTNKYIRYTKDGDLVSVASDVTINSLSEFNQIYSVPMSMSMGSGYWDWVNGEPGRKGTNSSYWTSTAASKNGMFNLTLSYTSTLNSGQIALNSVYNKVNGYTVRCVSRGTSLPDDYVAEEDDGIEIASCGAEKICYNGNGATSGEMSDQTATSNTSTMLTAPLYKKTGYAFAGWSTEENGFGEIYGPNQILTTPDLSSEGMQLYAKWVPSVGEFQTWTGCSAMDTDQVIGLTDNRDGKTYSVAKLKDGNCWMTQNLNLDLTAFTDPNADVTLNSSNTDLNSKTTWTPDATTLTTSFFSATTPRYLHYVDGDRSFYNWYAATAESGLVNTPTIDGVAPAQNPDLQAQDSICPLGWQLPTYYNMTLSKSWKGLLSSHSIEFSDNLPKNDTKFVQLSSYPLSIEAAGDYATNRNGFVEGIPVNRGTNSRYWTSTPNSETNAILMSNGNINDGFIHPYSNLSKAIGVAVRCVQR